MPCIHWANVSAHCALCSATLPHPKCVLKQSKSFRWDGHNLAPFPPASLSSTSNLFLRAVWPPAFGCPAPNVSIENVFMAALQASLLSISRIAFLAFRNSSCARAFSTIAVCASFLRSFPRRTRSCIPQNSCSSANRCRLNASSSQFTYL